MKILHIIRSVDPRGGGPIEGINQLSKPNMAVGHQVEILSLDAPGSDCVRQSPIRVHAVGPGMGKYGYSRHFKPWLVRHCEEYDAFIINGIWQYHSLATRTVLIDKGLPYYVFTHGMLDPWFKRAYPLKHLKKCLYWPWEYTVLRDAAAVLFTCEEERLLALESFRPNRWNEHVVNYGTAGDVSDAARQRELFLDAHPQLRGMRSLLFLSRIHPKKGVDLLIEAFAGVCGGNGDLHLVIAGPDQVAWQAELQRQAQRLGVAGRITWTGMLNGDMKWGAYLNAEAFVLPSHQENFGIVVAEALSCGVPVLISDKVNIWREIAMDGAGLVASDDLTGCVDLLQRWLQLDDEVRARMRANARACFVKRFEIGEAARGLLELLKQSTPGGGAQMPRMGE